MLRNQTVELKAPEYLHESFLHLCSQHTAWLGKMIDAFGVRYRRV